MPLDPHPSNLLDKPTDARVVELFRAFSNTSRVRILAALTDGELNVGTLAKTVRASGSAVSHHLRSLRQMQPVQARREGKQVYYRVEDEHIVALFQQGVKHVQYG